MSQIKTSAQDTNRNPAIDTGAFKTRIEQHEISIGVIGMGYVGLPLAIAFASKGLKVTGFDTDPNKVEWLKAGKSYIRHIPAEKIAMPVTQGILTATNDLPLLSEMDVIIVCVPTPLTRHREPDLSFIVSTAESIAAHQRRGQLVILESTTYPGTTREVMKPILERGGLASGTDFFLAYSPEREDPGNQHYDTTTTPKLVGGDGPDALRLAATLYGEIIGRVVSVSSPEVAEATKLTENIFRAVNIALVNELKVVYQAMGIDVWEVINAAKTKPFGFMPFYPGPGLGGHCIPIDPFYLTWKAREHELSTRFIELAGEINTSMPGRVVDRVAQAMNLRHGKSLRASRILVLGLAYKKNVDDTRESPAFKLIELLEANGAQVAYHDPYIAEIPHTREHPQYAGRSSVPLDRAGLTGFDCALICTDHDSVDYQLVVDACRLVVDTRNACASRGIVNDKIVQA
jgi:UDP-N-acetyl-D-glucosamine dehydrogenase